MALQVNFALAAELVEALRTLKQSEEHLAVIATIQSESVVLTKKVAATGNLEQDFAEIRSACQSLDAAFIILRRADSLVMLTYTPETVKPKTKMMFAACSSHLRQESKISSDQHISTVEEIIPTIFTAKANDRESLQSEKEREQRKIEEEQRKDLATAPARSVAMQSVGIRMTAEVLHSLQRVGDDIVGFAFSIEGAEVAIGQAFHRDHQVSEIPAKIPDDVPSFVLFEHAPGTIALGYICPASCKPKIRMQFAAAKPSIVAQLKESGIRIQRSVEVSAPSELLGAVEDSLRALPSEDPKPVAPAPKTMMKGPRMFMPE